MGTSYIAKDFVYTVCTYQLSSAPQKLSNSRETPTVFYGEKQEYPLLNIEDRNLDKQFACKSPWNIAASFLAFGAGLLVGLLLLSNPAGWIIAGCAAAAAVCITVGTVTAIKAINHKCTGPLSSGQWQLTHSSVVINGSAAITRSSILTCSSGGVLTPFFSYSSACQAARDISFNNKVELGVNTIGSFFAGAALPGSLVGMTFKAGAIMVGKFGAGYVFFSVAAWGEREIIRNANENIGELKDNEHYENINDVDPNTVFSAPSKPDDLTQDVTDVAKMAHAYNSGKLIIKDAQLAAKLKSLDGLSRQVLRTNPTAQGLLNDLNAGKYPEWQSQLRNPNSGRMTPSMVEDGKKVNNQSIKNNAAKIGNGLLFLLPFIGTYFSEQARTDLAKALAEDAAAAGLDVIANNPID